MIDSIWNHGELSPIERKRVYAERLERIRARDESLTSSNRRRGAGPDQADEWLRENDPDAKQKDRLRKRESVVDTNAALEMSAVRPSTRALDVPINEYDALMRCAPGDEPELSLAERMGVREQVADAWDAAVDDRERWILGAIINRGLSIREVGAELNLSKTHVHRLYQAALEKLRVFLLWGPDGVPTDLS